MSRALFLVDAARAIVMSKSELEFHKVRVLKQSLETLENEFADIQMNLLNSFVPSEQSGISSSR